MIKHTPGPWIVNNGQMEVGEGKLSIEAENEYFIAQVDEGMRQQENAKLISAAPDLLAALMNYVDGCSSSIDAASIARAAIAKATGEA